MNLALGSQVLPNLKPAAKPVAKPSAAQVSANSAEPKKFSDVLNDRDIQSKDVEAKSRDTNSSGAITDKNSKTKDLEEQAASVVTDKNQIKPITREAAMNVFLEKMKNELGMESSEILEAFSELSPADLFAPPEESAQQVLKNLGLEGEDKEKAMSLYEQMLAMTAAAGMSNYLDKSNSTANLHVMTDKEVRQQKLSSALDKMNNQFFMPAPFAGKKENTNNSAAIHATAETSTAAAANATSANQAPSFFDQNTAAAKLNSGETAILPQNLAAMSPEELSMKTSGATDSTTAMNLDSAVGASEPELPIFENTVKPNAMKATIPQRTTLEQLNLDKVINPQLEAKPVDINALPEPESMIPKNVAQLVKPDAQAVNTDAQFLQNNQSLTSHLDPVTPGLSAAPILGMNTDSNAGEDGDLGEDGESTADFTQIQNADVKVGKAQAGATPFILSASATPADVSENVKEIINQAQFLATKGGGEMKVTLSPDGIGEVNLKVKMAKGQVNIELITSNLEAKKMLENGLGELKDSLASHKLHLDSVKIENTRDLSNQLADQRQDLEKSFQQRFLNDFKNGNQARGEFFAQPMPRVPGSQTKDQAANAMYSGSSKRRDLSRRLDLVA